MSLKANIDVDKIKRERQTQIAIMKDKRISECTQAEREQVMSFAFGEDYMKSNDKGSKKLIEEK